MEEHVRARVIISGRVQGVFFRAETQRAAEDIGVTGWVRNRPEGTVEALFEGPRPAVQEAVAWCRRGSPLARVSEVQVTWEDYRGDLRGFVITR
jgi:acylphosphatase